MRPELLAVVAKWKGVAEPICETERVPLDLVLAIITHESKGDQWASRFEPMWPERWMWYPREMAEKANISLDTERTLQKTSFGLMQVMGAVAREFGHKGNLMMLIQPEISITYGCKKLHWLMERYHGETDVISAYNQGKPMKTPGGLYGNQKTYVDPVCAYLREIRA